MGNDDYGQSAADILYQPRQIGPATTTWSSVSSGYYHTCGIQSDASLWCWDNNSNGLAKVDSSSWASVDGGWSFDCGIHTDQTLWCWGVNNTNQLGDGTTTNRSSPVKIGTSTWSDVAAGSDDACGIKTNGTLWCWGHNDLVRTPTARRT